MAKGRVNNTLQKEDAKASRRKINVVWVVVCSLLAAALIATAIVMLVLNINKEEKPFDYVTADLSPYIYIPAENYTGYKGYEVMISIDKITDESVKTALMQARAAKRGEAKTNDKETMAKIEVGDDILLYFQGYSVDEDGNKGSAINGLGNFTVSDEGKRTYMIGGGSLDKLGLNLELKLVGQDLSKYTYCEIVEDGEIRENDILFVTYEARVKDDGEYSRRGAESERMNLADGGIDAVMGEGFTEMILGQKIGVAVENPSKLTYKSDEFETIRYTKIKVDYVLRPTDEGQEPLSIMTTIPSVYDNVNLQGSLVLFELYVSHAVKYEVPELNDKFIREDLGVSDETLAKYEGNNNTERFAAYTKDLLEKKNQAEIDAILIEAMWAHYYRIAEFKSLPEDEVTRLIEKQKKPLEEAYTKDSKDYKSFDEYAQAYVTEQLGVELVWSDYFRRVAESEIKEKLIFYYVARAEKLLPSDAEFAALAERVRKEDLEYTLLANGITREKYETDAEYEAAVAPYRADVEKYYADEEVLRWVVHREYAEAKMSKFGVVKYKEAESIPVAP